MEPYGHTEEVLGGVSLVFVYLRTLFLPQFKEETRSLNIYFPVPIIFILRLNKVFRLIAISQARILSLRKYHIGSPNLRNGDATIR